MNLDQFDLMLSYLAFMVTKEAEFGFNTTRYSAFPETYQRASQKRET